MRYGIGIDTGGTYTDAVLYDFENKAVLCKAKSLTTREDLTIGISGALKGLDASLFAACGIVSLSTTLATNACVEGKGCRAKLIVVGCAPKLLEFVGADYGLPPSREIITTAWGLEQDGTEPKSADWEGLKKAVLKASANADAFALVAQWGMKNPSFERQACRYVQEWTGKRVICAGDLAAVLNFPKRAATALLNARLIPVIDEFITAVKAVASRMGISAPIVMVKGDGSLMSQTYAAAHPIETLFSGPAASANGGIALTGEGDSVLLDMGGTTTDMALSRSGMVEMSEDGLNLGGWHTCTRAVRATTVGLGGDSRIRYKSDGTLLIGPERSIPLCLMAYTYPETLTALRNIQAYKHKNPTPWSEFLLLIKMPALSLTKHQHILLSLLQNGPRDVLSMSAETGLTVYEINLAAAELESGGFVQRCGLTPTDVMHLLGIYTPFCTEASVCGAADIANQTGRSADELPGELYSEITRKLFYEISVMLLNMRAPSRFGRLSQDTLKPFLDTAFDGGDPLISTDIRTGCTLVALGAPSYVFLPDTAKKLGCRCICPPNADVANAVGAVCGSITANALIEVQPLCTPAGIAGYHCFGAGEPRLFDNVETAVENAKSNASRIARDKAEEMGANGEIFVKTDVVYNYASVGFNLPEKKAEKEPEETASNRLLVGIRITARAAAKAG